MNILIGIDYLDPKLQIYKIGPVAEMCCNFHEIWHLRHFKISFNQVTNFIKELRDVKTFFPDWYSAPSQTPMGSFLGKKTCITRC